MAHQLAPLTEKPESLTQIVYQTLRDAIISKRLPPGQRVSEASLARQLRVSKTPVREALLRLQAIGLVEADGGRGGRIVRPSAELIRHTYEVRGSLESLAARLAAARASPAQRSQLAELAAASLGAAQGQDLDGFRRHDEEFHDLLAAAAANPYLSRLIGNAYTLSAAARQRDVPGAGAGGLLAACGSGSSTPAASSPTATAASKKGGALKVGLTGGSGSDTLDPHKGLTYLDTARAQSLYQPLLQLNTRAQTEFVLAEEISPRGSTSQWVIRLRPGITFHDGKPLTADDVIFTLSRIKNQKLTGSTPLGPVDVKGLKKLDKLTVQVPMTSPYGSFLDQLAYWYYLYIVPTGFDPAQPNGTGAFKYQSFTPGQRSVFVRNPNYWKP